MINNKNKKGISLMVLMVTIAVMTMLLTTATVAGVKSMERTKKMKFASELAFVKESVDSYILNNNKEYPVSNTIILDISKVSGGSIDQFNGEIISNNKVNLYEIDVNLLGKIDTVYGKKSGGNDDVFAISKDTKKIYYIRGLKVSSVTYYTLNDELKNIINFTSSEDSLIKDAIKFEEAIKDWTNQKVASKIKVPASYTNVVVTVKQTGYPNVILTGSLEENYNIYNAKSLDTDIVGNYSVSVQYKKGTTDTYEQNFEVKNYDGTKPSITFETPFVVKKMENKQTNELYSYINIVSSSDDKSGVKVIKYENVKLDASQKNTYFKTSGIIAQNNVLKIQEGSDYISVYIEDNAGNFEIYEFDL